ncbi:type II toxin-antitoxin system RelE/ParE family toxin [Vallitalea longa]|nr:type II toxin-antitoxin system RelE/ParE family toxin [Vallitalea longa]
MKVYAYKSLSGKDLINEYIEKLPKKEYFEAVAIIQYLEEDKLNLLNTRQLKGKLWEIKFYRHNRIMYVIKDSNSVYLLHACKKQKGKAEKFELEKALRRAKEILQ